MIVLQAAPATTPIIVVGIVMLVILLIAVLVFWSTYRPWFRAFMSGTPIPLPVVLGMKFRRSDANLIVDQGITASHAGFPITWVELERSYLSGVDLEKVVLAYITAKKRDLDYTFTEIVDAAQESRLDDLLKD